MPYTAWETAYQCQQGIKIKASEAHHKAGESQKKT